MGKFHPSIKTAHREFIEKQHLFFVATAPLSGDGRVNLSPKGLDCFRVLSEQQVGYMDLISSGNETSAHTLENGRISFMFCSFEGGPLILRLYGKGFAVLPAQQTGSFTRHISPFIQVPDKLLSPTSTWCRPPVDLGCLCSTMPANATFISIGRRKKGRPGCRPICGKRICKVWMGYQPI